MKQVFGFVAGGALILALLSVAPGCDSEAPPRQEMETALEAALSVTPATIPADGQTTALLELVVSQAADGLPAAGVAVEARSQRNGQGEVDKLDPPFGVTDAEGRWTARISSATPGEALVTVSSEGRLLCTSGAAAPCTLAEARVTFSEKHAPPVACTLELQGEIQQLTATAGHTSYPAVVAAPGGMLVAFDDDGEAGWGMFYSERAIYLARFDAQGAPSGAPRALSTAGVDAYRPSLVATGTGYALAYLAQQGSETAILLLRLDAAGEPEGQPLQLTSSANSPPSLAWSEGVLGVAFSGRPTPEAPSSTWLARYDEQGTALGAPVEVSADSSGDSPSYPRVAAGPAGFGVVWQDRRDGAWDLYFRLIGAAGAPAADELAIRQDDKSVAVAPQLVWTGSEFGIAYADTRHEYGHYQIYLARVAADGRAVLGEQQISRAEGNADTPGLISLDGRYYLSWVEKPWGGDAIPFALQASSGAIDTGADLGLPYNGAAPDIGAVEFGGPWPASDNWPTTIAVALVDPAADELTSQTVLAQNEGFSAFPALAADGAAVHVVWFDTLAAGGRDLFRAAVACLP